VQNAYPNAWDIVINAMTKVTLPGGTAQLAFSHHEDFPIAGKTGTAQVHAKRLGVMGEEDESDLPKEFRDHAWFIAFAPATAPRIAIAVLVEHGGGGGAVAAPVARQVMDAYLQGQGTEAPPQP
jgi:penicillin-binding protein 2